MRRCSENMLLRVMSSAPSCFAEKYEGRMGEKDKRKEREEEHRRIGRETRGGGKRGKEKGGRGDRT